MASKNKSPTVGLFRFQRRSSTVAYIAFVEAAGSYVIVGMASFRPYYFQLAREHVEDWPPGSERKPISETKRWMIAKDAGLFRKQDLDVDLVFMGSSNLIIQSMLAGSVPVAGVAGPAVIASVVAGGDVVTVANLAPLTIALMVNPSIRKPEDLKGKKIGVPRLGAVAHFAIRMILDRQGIKDAAIIQMGSQPEAAAGMRRQSIDGAMISLPLNYVLEKEGYRQLVGPQDYRKLGIQFISQGISAQKSYIASNRDVVLRLIKATMEGLKLMSTQENAAKKSLRNIPARPTRSRSTSLPLRAGNAKQGSNDPARSHHFHGASDGRSCSHRSLDSKQHAAGSVLRQQSRR